MGGRRGRVGDAVLARPWGPGPPSPRSPRPAGDALTAGGHLWAGRPRAGGYLSPGPSRAWTAAGTREFAEALPTGPSPGTRMSEARDLDLVVPGQMVSGAARGQ